MLSIQLAVNGTGAEARADVARAFGLYDSPIVMGSDLPDGGLVDELRQAVDDAGEEAAKLRAAIATEQENARNAEARSQEYALKLDEARAEYETLAKCNAELASREEQAQEAASLNYRAWQEAKRKLEEAETKINDLEGRVAQLTEAANKPKRQRAQKDEPVVDNAVENPPQQVETPRSLPTIEETAQAEHEEQAKEQAQKQDMDMDRFLTTGEKALLKDKYAKTQLSDAQLREVVKNKLGTTSDPDLLKLGEYFLLVQKILPPIINARLGHNEMPDWVPAEMPQQTEVVVAAGGTPNLAEVPY
jgi:hypothetical protein